MGRRADADALIGDEIEILKGHEVQPTAGNLPGDDQCPVIERQPVLSVMADVERPAEFSGAACDACGKPGFGAAGIYSLADAVRARRKAGRHRLVRKPRSPHRLEAVKRLGSPDEDRTTPALGLGDGVEAVMHPVDQVDVGMSRRAEHDSVARGGTAVRMGGRIIGEVGLGLDDAGNADPGVETAHDELSQEITGYVEGSAIVEGGREWVGSYH